jgi:hypothetical protein
MRPPGNLAGHLWCQVMSVNVTRPREYLLVTSVAPASEFLDDMVK